MSPEEKLRLMNIAEAAALIAHYIDAFRSENEMKHFHPNGGRPRQPRQVPLRR
jgi:hypothetical protein